MITFPPFLLLFAFPIFALIYLFVDRSKRSAKVATKLVWLGFFSLVGLWAFSTLAVSSYGFFYVNSLSYLIGGLVFLVSGSVHSFSLHYLDGSLRYNSFFKKLSALTLLAFSLVVIDHFIIFTLLCFLTNYTLTTLLNHNKGLKAAHFSSSYALKFFLLSAILQLSGFSILTHLTHISSFSGLNSISVGASHLQWPLILILVSACIQSAIFPFHRWLTNSLNAPTPVSSFMHAGIVNGGGLLLLRLTPLYKAHPYLLSCVLVLGFVTFLVATFWKLMQSNIKGTLVYSTVAQMGLMFIQCGLGLFSAAIAHSICHGLFKAYLFLRSGSVLNDKVKESNTKSSLKALLASLMIAPLSMYCFEKVAMIHFSYNSSYFVLALFAYLAAAQSLLSILKDGITASRLFISGLFSIAIGSIYGLVIKFIHLHLPIGFHGEALELSKLHIISLFITFTLWGALNFINLNSFKNTAFGKWAYFKLLNSSTPHIDASVITQRERKAAQGEAI